MKVQTFNEFINNSPNVMLAIADIEDSFFDSAMAMICEEDDISGKIDFLTRGFAGYNQVTNKHMQGVFITIDFIEYCAIKVDGIISVCRLTGSVA